MNFRPARRRSALGCGCATFIVLLVLAFVAGGVVSDKTNPRPALEPSSETDYDSTYFQDHATLTLITTPGRTYTIHILDVNQSPDGVWAAPQGLQFVLDGPSGTSQVVLQPKAESWGSVITIPCGQPNGPTSYCSAESENFNVPCSLTVPSVPDPTEQTITGRITGTITYPSASGSFFVDSSVELDVPITIKLISPEHYAQLTKQIEENGGVIALIFFLSIIPIGLIAWWVGRKYARH